MNEHDLTKALILKFNNKKEGKLAKIRLEEAKTYFSMKNLSLETKTIWATYKIQDITLE